MSPVVEQDEKDPASKVAPGSFREGSNTSISNNQGHLGQQSTETELYSNSVGEAYCLKSELVAEHLARIGFGK